MGLRTKRERRQFVKELIDGGKQQILKLIDGGKIPEDWDGHELRHLIADYFAGQTFALTPSRKREYNNEVLVNNLL